MANAIKSANADSSVGGCTAGSGADIIIIPQNIASNIELPRVTSEITIEGNLYVLSTNLRTRLLTVSAGGNLQINSLRFAAAGGAPGFLSNAGTLLVTGSSFRNGDSTKGGAIFNEGTLTVRNSFFSGNSSRPFYGGAIRNEGNATIVNSTFTKNRSLSGTAFASNEGSQATIINSTFYQNSMIGGGNGEGNAVYSGENGGTNHVNLYNSIVAGNGGRLACKPLGGFTSTNNYADAAACSAAFDLGDGPIKLGTLVEPADGSPAYFPLLDGSPALGNGHPEHCPATDQLGNARPNPSGSNCDLGAVESSIVPPTETATATVTTTPTEVSDCD